MESEEPGRLQMCGDQGELDLTNDPVRRRVLTRRSWTRDGKSVTVAILASLVSIAAWAAESVATPTPAPPGQTPSSPPPATTPSPGPSTAPAPIPTPPSPSYPSPPGYYPPSYVHPQNRRWGRVYTAEEEREGVFRPLSLTLAVGPGMLIGPGERDIAVSYNVFRLGIGIVRNLSFFISYEGAGSDSTNPATGEDSWLSQNHLIFGPQFHFLRRFHVRAGIGLGSVMENTRRYRVSNGTSLTYAGALGLEFLQAKYLALGFEASASSTHYSHESWQTIGWDLTLAFY